ncbi:hypothetical protein RI543_000856 [Arxiozyma heterogenica]|uniref:Uncharacterized protein n=1 Tax=Arxiozyma heterogenica TaxID=278026 RepID=A0AAN7WJS5_9SACH|nr:hypothetical protein RI543_000856 [Kazachstania heterogenica]
MLHKRGINNNTNTNNNNTNSSSGSSRNTSIKEENEPCELHEQLNCSLCMGDKMCSIDRCVSGEKDKLTYRKETGYSKCRYHLNTSDNSSILKRSISSNAVNNVKKRASLSFSATNLHRTLSQSSCYSTGSTQSAPIELQEELFNEFFNYVTRKEQYNKVNNIWEILPRETKDMFIKRVLAKKKKLNNERKLVYNDLRNVLIMRDEFNLYADNDRSDSIHILDNNNNNNNNNNNRSGCSGDSSIKTNNDNNTQTKRDSSRRKKDFSYFSQREQILSQIIGELFEEVSKREIQYLRDDQSIGNQINESSIELKNNSYKRKKASWNVQASIKSKLSSRESPESLLLEDNTTMEKIRLWRDRQEINDKISELNRLIERYEQLSPLHTPISSSIKSKPDEGGSTSKQINNITTNENSHKIFDIFTSKSKKFIRMFKHKKKSSKFDLYRKPNPNVQQLTVGLKELKEK